MVERILYALDRDDSGAVQWTEFIAAVLCMSVCRKQPLVHAAFSVFDQDCDGKVSSDDILAVFAPAGDHTAAMWREQIREECARLAPRSVPQGDYSREQFETYVGAPMRTIRSEELFAVMW